MENHRLNVGELKMVMALLMAKIHSCEGGQQEKDTIKSSYRKLQRQLNLLA